MKKVYVTWRQVQDFVYLVCASYAGTNVTGVYGLPRGGLIPAVMISHKLNIPFLMSPCENCIIVDDICDSGESLVHYVKNTSNPDMANKFHIATIYFKENRFNIIPEVYLEHKKNDWIVFPWEGDWIDESC